MITEPMLAATIKDLEKTKFKFPLIVTPKLNGWRCLKVGGQVLTRKFKPQPNKFVRETLEKILPNGIDGELLIRGGTYNDVQSQISRRDGEPDFEFWAFDYVAQNRVNRPYELRLKDIREWYYSPGGGKSYAVLKYLEEYWVDCLGDLYSVEQKIVGDGTLHEGICIRTPDSPYKCGRSTLREQYLMKYKRFEDSEFEVLDFIELRHNENVAEQDAFGRTKRSHKTAGKIAGGTLGALLVKDIHHGWEFEIGTGWTAAERQEIWDNKKKYRGKIGNYKYQKHGFKDKPPAASFQGWRYD